MSKHIAHPDPTAVLDTVAKFFRIMSKAGASLQMFMQPMQNITKRKNLAEYLSLGCPKVNGEGAISATPSNHDLARLILGNDFITPEEVAATGSLSYTDEQLEALENSLPTIEKIAWCRGNGFMILPAPPKALSLLEVRSLKPNLFYTDAWYTEEREIFSRNERTEAATWLMVRKNLVPNSSRKSWYEQVSLISNVERIPSAVELVWALTTYKEVRGIYLMNNFAVQTSSVCSVGTHVHVGHFSPSGMIIHRNWNDDGDFGIGLSSVLNN